MWASACRPIFESGLIKRQGDRDATASRIQCPEALGRELANNNLLVDHDTDATGNCGVDGFLRSWRAMDSKVKHKHRSLRTCWQPQRNASIIWLEKHRHEAAWGTLSVENFCLISSGKADFQEYLNEMAKPDTWVDTAFLHAMACANSVDVVLIQAGMAPVLLGISTHQGQEPDGENDGKTNDPTVVPMALVNDVHFWGVLSFETAMTPPVEDEEQGRRPQLRASNSEALCSLQVGEDEVAPKTGANEEYVEREFALNIALSKWNPWRYPTQDLIDAMAPVASDPKHAQSHSILTRQSVLSDLALESVHAQSADEHLTYRRAARWRIEKPDIAWSTVYQQRRRAVSALRDISCQRCNKSSIERMLSRQCSQGRAAHTCLQPFSVAQVLNWRVLWSSLPNFMRHELLLSEARDQLAKHRASGQQDKNFEMSYSFLGLNVCRSAFMMLTGLGVPFLQTARAGALNDKESYAPRSELGAWRRIANAVWPQKYLDARQWLLAYADKFGSWNPARDRCHLPAGRREFYYAAYVADRVQQGCRPPQEGGKRKRRIEDNIIAEPRAFLRAWSVELPWLLVNVSAGTFVHCPLCDYIELLIERTSRAQQALREMFRDRLGAHFQFQGMQRLAQADLEEMCAQSQGSKWFMKIDKMENSKLACATVWSQLATPLFKDQHRLVTGLVGSMWHGTPTIQHHVRTLFDDCGKGSEMQFSTILLNLFEVFSTEGRVPEEFYVGADNTYKETKNQYVLWAFVWLLCLCTVLGLPLVKITLVFLMVGHTHDALDRFFSRVFMALRGRNWITPDDMLDLLREHVLYTKVRSGHVRQVWAWKDLAKKEVNPCYREIQGLRHVHQIELSRTAAGIGIRWKQWMSDKVWSSFHILVPPEEIATIAAFRPHSIPMKFLDANSRLEWINVFEQWCANMPTKLFENVTVKCSELRQLVRHEAPGAYAPGPTLDELLGDVQRYSGGRVAPNEYREDPDATFGALFPAQNATAIKPDLLLKIKGLTHDAHGMALRSDLIVPGSNLVVRRPPDSTWAIHGFAIEFLACVVMQSPSDMQAANKCLVAWYLPPLAQRKLSGGKKGAQQIDIFGSWKSLTDTQVKDLRGAQLPDPEASLADVLDANFEMTENNELPYDTFDTLRLRHNLDVTALSASQTPRGNLYRAYVLSKGAAGVAV